MADFLIARGAGAWNVSGEEQQLSRRKPPTLPGTTLNVLEIAQALLWHRPEVERALVDFSEGLDV